MNGKTLGEGLVDKAFNNAEAKVPMSGVDIFKLWLGQRNLVSAFSSAWQYDLGKLVVLNVFMDVYLLRVVVDRYDPILRVIRGNEGEVFLSIIREEF